MNKYTFKRYIFTFAPCVTTELSLQHKSVCTLQWVVSNMSVQGHSLVRFKGKQGGNVFSVEQEMDFNMDMSVAHTVVNPVLTFTNVSFTLPY